MLRAVAVSVTVIAFSVFLSLRHPGYNRSGAEYIAKEKTRRMSLQLKELKRYEVPPVIKVRSVKIPGTANASR